MKNLILIKSKYVKFYTHLRNVFNQVDEFRNCKWVLSNLELNCNIDGIDSNAKFSQISGCELYKIISKMEYEPQIIWGVLSGFNNCDDINFEIIPYADGNDKYWAKGARPQMINSLFEIVCIDSTLTLFIGMNEIMCDKLYKLYPDIILLDDYLENLPNK